MYTKISSHDEAHMFSFDIICNVVKSVYVPGKTDIVNGIHVFFGW